MFTIYRMSKRSAYFANINRETDDRDTNREDFFESSDYTSDSDKENHIPSTQVSTDTPKKTTAPRLTPIKQRELS